MEQPARNRFQSRHYGRRTSAAVDQPARPLPSRRKTSEHSHEIKTAVRQCCDKDGEVRLPDLRKNCPEMCLKQAGIDPLLPLWIGSVLPFRGGRWARLRGGQRDVLREVPCYGARGVPLLRGATLPAHRHGRGQLGVVGRAVQRDIRRGQRSTSLLAGRAELLGGTPVTRASTASGQGLSWRGNSLQAGAAPGGITQ